MLVSLIGGLGKGSESDARMVSVARFAQGWLRRCGCVAKYWSQPPTSPPPDSQQLLTTLTKGLAVGAKWMITLARGIISQSGCGSRGSSSRQGGHCGMIGRSGRGSAESGEAMMLDIDGENFDGKILKCRKNGR